MSIDYSPTYIHTRDEWLNATHSHRESSVEELRRLIPEGVTAITLDLNDTPRLAITGYLLADGTTVTPWQYDEEHDVPSEDLLDQIAMDTDLTDWEVVDDYFHRTTDDSDGWIVERGVTR